MSRASVSTGDVNAGRRSVRSSRLSIVHRESRADKLKEEINHRMSTRKSVLESANLSLLAEKAEAASNRSSSSDEDSDKKKKPAKGTGKGKSKGKKSGSAGDKHEEEEEDHAKEAP